MQTKIKVSNFLVCLFALVLCGSLYVPIKAQKIPIALEKKTVLSPANRTTYTDAATEYKKDRTPERRDRLIFMAISQIDLNFGYYQKNRRYKNNLFQTVMDILEVGAATAISITNGERPKSLIADGLGFLQGSRTKINKNLRLLEQQILFNKMIEKRSEILTQILNNVKYTDAQYPFERAFVDVVAYYEAGTMDSALSSLATDTGADAKDAERNLADAKKDAGIILAPTEQQIKISRQNREFIDSIVESHEKADEQITNADSRIVAADKIIEDEGKKPNPDNAVIQKAKDDKSKAEGDKTTAKATQTEALGKLKAIFKSIEEDSELSPLLDELPEKYPNLASKIEARLTRIRANKGTVDDYGLTILQLLGLVKDAVTDRPTVVERTKNILDSVK